MEFGRVGGPTRLPSRTSGNQPPDIQQTRDEREFIPERVSDGLVDTWQTTSQE